VENRGSTRAVATSSDRECCAGKQLGHVLSHHARRDSEENLCLAHCFSGEKTYHWHYDLMFVLMNLLILFADGGGYAIDAIRR